MKTIIEVNIYSTFLKNHIKTNVCHFATKKRAMECLELIRMDVQKDGTLLHSGPLSLVCRYKGSPAFEAVALVKREQ